MPRVRLTGLFLFITAILLGLASAATRTTHIRFQEPAATNPQPAALPGSANGLPQDAPPVEFIAVPIVYPLTLVGMAGLVLWFVPAAIFPDRGSSQRKSKNKRRSSSKKSKPAQATARRSGRGK